MIKRSKRKAIWIKTSFTCTPKWHGSTLSPSSFLTAIPLSPKNNNAPLFTSILASINPLMPFTTLSTRKLMHLKFMKSAKNLWISKPRLQENHSHGPSKSKPSSLWNPLIHNKKLSYQKIPKKSSSFSSIYRTSLKNLPFQEKTKSDTEMSWFSTWYWTGTLKENWLD